MKRILLILILIFIITRILQQIYFRTNVVRTIDREEFTTAEVNTGIIEVTTDGFWPLSTYAHACTHQFGSYSDSNQDDFAVIQSLSIGTQATESDKGFFLGKGLMNWLKASLCKNIDSIDVWISVFTSTMEGFKGVTSMTFNRLFHSSVSDLITGLLLGSDSASKGSNSHLYKVTGTQHLFAISGFHLTFIVAFVNNLYSNYFSKSMVILCNLVISWLYVCLVGLSPGLFRAFAMFAISNLAWYHNRQKWAIHSFTLTFLLVILIDIQALSSIGFQLSYSATFGILIFISLFDNFADISNSFFTDFSRVGGGILHYFYSSILISFAAQIAVFPLLIYHFHEISLVGVIATTVVSWTIPIILQYGFFIAIIQFFVSHGFLIYFSLPLFMIAKLLFFLLSTLSFDNAVITVADVPIWVIFAIYSVIILIYTAILFNRRSKTINKHEEIYHFCL